MFLHRFGDLLNLAGKSHDVLVDLTGEPALNRNDLLAHPLLHLLHNRLLDPNKLHQFFILLVGRILHRV